MVMIYISHSRVQDLAVYLIAPDATTIELTNGAGGVNGQHYDSTFFAMNALRTTLMNQAPFRDTFYPRQNIGFVNNGQNPNGTWRLVVQDVLAGDSGVVNSGGLFFDNQPPRVSQIQNTGCNMLNAGGCVCSDSLVTTDCLLLPDIIISKNWFTDSALGIAHYEEFAGSFNISNMLANIGEGPLEFIGTGRWFCGDSMVAGNQLCPNGNYARQQLKQRVYIKNRFGFFDYVDTIVGYMGFHAELGHNHLHIDDITQNTLRIKGPEADPRLWPIVAKGTKVSFALYDYVRCGTFEACQWDAALITSSDLPNAGLGNNYGATNLSIQGISVGFADLYEYNLLGQNVDLDSTVCNGDYYLVGEFDPKNTFVDKQKQNNAIYGKITLTKQQENCCKANFKIDTIDLATNTFRFVDLSEALPQQWQWDFGDGNISIDQFPIHSFSNGGLWNVSLSTATRQGCQAQASKTIRTTVGIEQQSSLVELAVYPNPSSEKMYIDLKSNEKAELSLFDMQGKQLWSASHEGFETKFSISIANAGVYLLSVKSTTYHKQIKLLKVK
jgi:PKD repeat protein